MDLAFATGHGPRLLTDIEGQGPLVREEDVFVFGYRDGEEQIRDGSQPLPPAIHQLDLAAVRRLGIEAAAAEALKHVAREILPGSLSTWMPTASTTKSCRRSSIVCPAGCPWTS